MKNWEPLVLGPALAMDKVPAPPVVHHGAKGSRDQ
jgi:hypothetical protein